uniref:Uncharacterized protein n=1 Tax=Candidatus Berkiella aquae TaxID=295108 RepID=A0A0Q9YUE2_9GAMM
MQDYVPVSLGKSWKNKFLGYHLKYFQSKMILHEKNIFAICKNPSTSILKRLNTDSFWEDLKSLSPKKEVVEKYHDIWKKVKPLAHLNARNLLSLLQDQVLPLERTYQQALKSFEDERISVDASDYLPSHWFYPQLNQNISKIRENQTRLASLKAIIYEGLLWRSQAHSLLKAPRNVDDIVGAVCMSINSLDLLKSPFEIKTPYSSTLDDDKRLTIYDYLEKSTLNKDNLHTTVLGPIPKQGYTAFKSNEKVQNDLKQIKKIHKKTFNNLINDGPEESFFPPWFNQMIPRSVKKAWKNAILATKDMFSDLGLLSPLLKLWNYRYIAFLALTLLSYHFLILAIQPVASVLLGPTIFGLLDSSLFYSFALAPLWALGWNLLNTFKQIVINYFVSWKKEEIYESLDTLVLTQEFMANHLSQVIIDIPHFDIKELTQQANFHFNQLARMKKKLDRFYFGEKFLCRGNVSKNIELILEKIQDQKKQLQLHLKQVTNHIALRIGDDIEQLEKSASKHELIQIIPLKQLENLKNFVTTFGDELSINKFEQNANPIYKWMNKIERCSMAQKPADDPFAQPWGSRVVRKDNLRGWEIILKGYISKGPKQDAALQINKLLDGKIHPSMPQLQELVRELGIGDKAGLFLSKVQDHIFKTLDSVNPQNSRLVSKQHQDLICSWYQQHKEEIQQAERTVKQLFSTKQDDHLVAALNKLGDVGLCNIYRLLDGADIHSYLSNNNEDVNHRKNLARQYFENYKGETSRAIRFLRFISHNNRKELLPELAKKRVTWLLEHLGQGVSPSKPFDETDTELFHNYRLIQTSEKFNFTSFVMKSKQFNNPWDQNVESFLDSCRRNGFDSGKLANSYKKRNLRVKPFILHQHEHIKNNAISCKLEADKLSSTSFNFQKGGIDVKC